MRRAVISDIHGNLVALQAVLEDCKTRKVDEIVCLGDICGYGPDPIACVDLCRSACKWVLLGNHDYALFLPEPVGFNRLARDAILWQKALLKPKWYSLPSTKNRWSFLQRLKPDVKDGRGLYVHASPHDPLFEYVEEQDFTDMGLGLPPKAMRIMDCVDYLAFCGHSHKPGVVNQEYQWILPADLPGMRYNLPETGKTLVNVGAVGQPRDNNPDSCYVIYDDKENWVQFHRVRYDVAKAQERFKGIKALDERLWKRLATGN